MTLSPRELEIVSLVSEGLDSKAIANKLGIQVGTVRNQVQRAMDKLGIHNRILLAKWYVSLGIVNTGNSNSSG